MKIHNKINVLTDDELFIVRVFLKKVKTSCLYIRNEHPRGLKLMKDTKGLERDRKNHMKKHKIKKY